MARIDAPILVDTNVILECHRTASWRALAGGFRMETVTECVIETQTGFQRRRPEQQIDETTLRQALAAVHDVTKAARAMLFARDALSAYLDPGEQHLWAHAVARSDAWLLCGPDKASLRLGFRLGFRDRLVGLEALLDQVGFRPKLPLRMNYTSRWLAQYLSELAFSEGPRK
jgi:hypothetical protein